MVKELTIPEKGVLVVHGPAKLDLVDGKFFISGAEVEKRSIIVPATRGLSIIPISNTSLIRVAEGTGSQISVFTRVEAISKWIETVNMLKETGAKRVLVLGKPDTGKSTFSLWVYNSLRSCFLETDIGQNELGAPATVSTALPRDAPIFTFNELVADYAWFVGHVRVDVVSEMHYAAILSSLKICRDKLIIDSDGYVVGRGFVHKLGLISIVEPDYIVELKAKNDTICLFSNTARTLGIDYTCLESVHNYLRVRKTIDRRSYRNRVYARLFKDSKTFNLNASLIANLCPFRKTSEAAPNECTYYTCFEQVFLEKPCKQLPDKTSMEYFRLKPTWARGILSGIRLRAGYDIIGVMEKVSIENNTASIRVPLRYAKQLNDPSVVQYVQMGYIRLDSEYREIEKYEPGIYPQLLFNSKRLSSRSRRKNI